MAVRRCAPLDAGFLDPLPRRAATVRSQQLRNGTQKRHAKLEGNMECKGSQHGVQMDVKIAPKSTKWPPRGVPEATFCENGRPSPNTAIIVQIAHPTPPGSFHFVPFGPKRRPKALLERRRKTAKKQTPKVLNDYPKRATPSYFCFMCFCSRTAIWSQKVPRAAPEH